MKHKKFLEDFSLLAELTAEDKDNFEKAKVDSIEEEYEATLLRNKAGTIQLIQGKGTASTVPSKTSSTTDQAFTCSSNS